MQALRDVATEAHAAGVLVLLASPNADVEAAIAASGLGAALGGADRFVYTRVHEAVRALLLRRVTTADLPRPPAPAAAAPPLADASSSGDRSRETWGRGVLAAAARLLRTGGLGGALLHLGQGLTGRRRAAPPLALSADADTAVNVAVAASAGARD